VRWALPLLLLVGAPLGAAAQPVLGPEGTEIASSFDEHDPFDLHIGVNYGFQARRIAIKREYAGLDGSTPDGPMPIAKDLLFQQRRHVLTPHLSIGIFQGLQLSAALPIVLHDSREFLFDQRASPCVFPPDPEPTCIDRRNSSTIRDGLLPSGAGGDPLGYDARDPTGGFAPDSRTVFRGVDRSGLDQVHVGLAWAPLRQELDDTKPTWVIGLEYRVPVGRIMRFDRLEPSRETGVGRGIHELRAWTGLSRRTTWSEPYVFFWWQGPVKLQGTTPEDPGGSLFWDVGFGQQPVWPQHRAGTRFGFEAIPWENKREQQRLSVIFEGRIEAHFQGRAYSPMWEIFAFAGDRVTHPDGELVLDRDPTTPGVQPMSHPGVTMVESYMTFGGRFGLGGHVGENARFSATLDVAHDQAHRITWTNAGVDRNGNMIVDPGTSEVNPLYVPDIDLAGRRYIADETIDWTFLISGTLLF
jgi:hypothetical protein